MRVPFPPPPCVTATLKDPASAGHTPGAASKKHQPGKEPHSADTWDSESDLLCTRSHQWKKATVLIIVATRSYQALNAQQGAESFHDSITSCTTNDPYSIQPMLRLGKRGSQGTQDPGYKAEAPGYPVE